MLKVKLWTESGDFLRDFFDEKGRTDSNWARLLKSSRSLHQPGTETELKRPYNFEPVVFHDGTINVAQNFSLGTNYVLIEKKNFVAIWGYAVKQPGGYYAATNCLTWFRYYFAPDQSTSLIPTVNVTINGVTGVVIRRRRRSVKLVLYRLNWSQLGSRLQQEVMKSWEAVAPSWMQTPEFVARYRPGLITSGRVGRIPGINADLITEADPYVIEIGDVVMLVGQLSDDDIML